MNRAKGSPRRGWVQAVFWTRRFSPPSDGALGGRWPMGNLQVQTSLFRPSAPLDSYSSLARTSSPSCPSPAWHSNLMALLDYARRAGTSDSRTFESLKLLVDVREPVDHDR